MRLLFRFAATAVTLFCVQGALIAQDLAPRAYLILPLRSNAITLTYSFYDGSILLDGAAPITGATGQYSVPIFSLYHSLNFFGRSANLTISIPYAVGNFQATVVGEEREIYRSGFLDSVIRFSVNLKGGPAMTAQEFGKWRQKAIIGASLKVLVPTGQYDSTKLINWSANRWAFKPELGYSQRWGHWLLDAYGAVWFFTENPEFFPGALAQTQGPIGALEAHLSYDFRPRFWVSLDGNFWFGGSTSLNGIENPLTRQKSSRIGGTVAVPISKHQSLKFSYSNGTYVRFGGDYQNVSVAWQYGWIGKP